MPGLLTQAPARQSESLRALLYVLDVVGGCIGRFVRHRHSLAWPELCEKAGFFAAMYSLESEVKAGRLLDV